jgi:nucleoside transporter
MAFGIRWRLSAMMFLEYAIWGAWAPVLGAYLLNNLHFSGGEVGWIYSMLPLATIVAPMLFGQIADRYVNTEYLLAVLSLASAVLLWVMLGMTTFLPFLIVMLLYSLVFAPTLVLTNSLAFDHLKNSEKEFGSIRVLGTVGWMIAAYTLTFWLRESSHLTQGTSLHLAAIFAVGLAILSLALPHTPPKKEGSDPLAFMKAFRLMSDRNFAVFMAISFVVATELQFYYVLTAPFLQDMGVKPANTSSVMTIAQAAEFVVMGLVLPWVLPRLGVRKIMVIGILAWPIRYAIFALAWYHGPSALPVVEAALTLHGFCYVFFFVVGFIYVDQVAPPDIRASAQALIGVVALGLGSYIGSLIAGYIKGAFTRASGATDWIWVFLIPCFLTVLCAIVFPMLFKAQEKPVA